MYTSDVVFFTVTTIKSPDILRTSRLHCPSGWHWHAQHARGYPPVRVGEDVQVLPGDATLQPTRKPSPKSLRLYRSFTDFSVCKQPISGLMLALFAGIHFGIVRKDPGSPSERDNSFLPAITLRLRQAHGLLVSQCIFSKRFAKKSHTNAPGDKKHT